MLGRSPASESNHVHTPRTISTPLLDFLRAEFQLDWRGIHGVSHWSRVHRNGLDIAEHEEGANPRVVELFAFLHDVRRHNDGYDPEHGARSAELARELNGQLFTLDAAELKLLETACREHSDGHRKADITVQACWDADRLDLGRVGIRPDPARLCTDWARNPSVLAAAYERSTQRRSR
jgi:uncharacterized protein